MAIDAAYARNYFVSRGYSAGGAAGIVGNLMQESGGSGKLNTSARNVGDGSDGTDSIGIAQWNSGRARELKAFAAGQGKAWTDGDVQLAFVDRELTRDHSSIAARLRQDITPAEGAKAFIGFERPKGWNTGGGEIGNRVRYANQIAGIKGDGVDGSGIGVTSNTTGEMSSDGNELAGGSGSSSGATTTAAGGTGSGSVPAAIDRQTDAETAADDASRTATFDSLKDYAGRFIIVALGLIFVAGGVFLFAKGSPPGRALRKAVGV